MDSHESLDFSSSIIFSDDPWSLLDSFHQLFKLPLVVQCCNVICEWPLTRDHNCENSDARTGARCGVELETKVFVVRTVILDIHAEVLVLGAGCRDR